MRRTHSFIFRVSQRIVLGGNPSQEKVDNVRRPESLRPAYSQNNNNEYKDNKRFSLCSSQTLDAIDFRSMYSLFNFD